MKLPLRPRPTAALGGVCAALVALAPAATASAGGATVPPSSGSTGGAEYGQPAAWHQRRPVASLLKVGPTSATAGRALPKITLRIDQEGVQAVRARIVLWPGRAAGSIVRVDLGRVPTGRTITAEWPRGTRLAAGTYTVRLHATAPDGATLLRRAKASGRAVLRVRAAPAPPPAPRPAPAPAVSGAGVFPVQGPYTFGGEGSGFGAGRDDHIHEGQDISATRGTPVVAPLAGTIRQAAYQKDGAGWYVVQDADDGRAFFFAHCRAGTVVVAAGDRISGGGRVCDVGNTGSSNGPHLHFEIWLGGWRVDEHSKPIDPLPQLQAWAG